MQRVDDQRRDLVLLDAATQKRLATLHAPSLVDAQFSPDSRRLLVATETGKLLFEHQIGTGQKAPLVLADNKLSVGTENGRFFTLRLRPDRVDVLNEVQLPISTDSVGGSEGTPEQIVSGAAISRGRVFFVSSDAEYAIGPKAPKALRRSAPPFGAAGFT